MKKKTVWKTPNSDLKPMKEKELLKILGDEKKTKELLAKLNKVEKTSERIKKNSEGFIQVTKENIDEFTKMMKFDSLYIWFNFIKKCLPESLNNESFIEELKNFLIKYLIDTRKEEYYKFMEDSNNTMETENEVQD